jgi:hypothetical protein
VANHVDFSNFGHACEIVVALKLMWNDFIERSFIDVERRQTKTCATGLRALED